MTKIVVVGDSGVGKTTFMHLAATGAVPQNVFRSTDIELFRPIRDASFLVVNGGILDVDLQRICTGADGILVLYRCGTSVHVAKRWLTRLNRTMVNVARVPVIICCHTDGSNEASNMNIHLLLRGYPRAEHTLTSVARPAGIQDCVNRVVLRARRDHPSPLAVRQRAPSAPTPSGQPHQT